MAAECVIIKLAPVFKKHQPLTVKAMMNASFLQAELLVSPLAVVNVAITLLSVVSTLFIATTNLGPRMRSKYTGLKMA